MKKWTTVAIVAALMVSTAATPFAADVNVGKDAYGGSISGDNTVKSPIYSYQIPKSVEFVVDPFQKAETQGQIFSGDFAVINKSDVALRANVQPSVALVGSNINLVASPMLVSNATDAATNKDVYLELVPANSAVIKVTPGTPATVATDKVVKPVMAAGAPLDVTYTEGDASTSAAAKMVLDTNTYVTEAVVEKAKFDLVITSSVTEAAVNYITELARVTSVATPNSGADTKTADGLAGLFKDQVLSISNPANPSETLYFKAGVANNVITLTQVKDSIGTALAPVVDTEYGFATLQAYIEPSRGVAATAALDMTTSRPSYPEYSASTGAATTERVALSENASSEKAITFTMAKATYNKNFVDETEPTLIEKIEAATAAGVFRLFGTVNPNVAWAEDDLKVTLKFDIGGITQNAYGSPRAPSTAAMNLVSSATEPSFDTNTTPPSTFDCSVDTELKYTFVNGTKESKLVDQEYASTGFSASFKVDGADAIDLTYAAEGILEVDAGVPTITFTKAKVLEALLPFAEQVNGKDGIMTITFTASDNHVTTLAAPLTVSNVTAPVAS